MLTVKMVNYCKVFICVAMETIFSHFIAMNTFAARSLQESKNTTKRKTIQSSLNGKIRHTLLMQRTTPENNNKNAGFEYKKTERDNFPWPANIIFTSVDRPPRPHENFEKCPMPKFLGWDTSLKFLKIDRSKKQHVKISKA